MFPHATFASASAPNHSQLDYWWIHRCFIPESEDMPTPHPMLEPDIYHSQAREFH